MSIQDTIKQRQNVHGDFRDNAMCSQRMKHIIESSKNWPQLNEVEREAIHMISSKLSRILTGNPHEPDHWHDIAGYATLTETYITSDTRLKNDQITEEPKNELRKVWMDMDKRHKDRMLEIERKYGLQKETEKVGKVIPTDKYGNPIEDKVKGT